MQLSHVGEYLSVHERELLYRHFMAPVSRRTFLAGLIAAPAIAALTSKPETVLLCDPSLYGWREYAATIDAHGAHPNLGQIVAEAWEKQIRELNANVFNSRELFDQLA